MKQGDFEVSAVADIRSQTPQLVLHFSVTRQRAAGRAGGVVTTLQLKEQRT